MNSNFREYGRSIALGALIGMMMAGIFAAGFFVRDLIRLPPALALSSEDSTYLLVSEVEYLLEQHYLRELPDETVREYGAIRGLLNTLGDGNTFFIEPPVAQSESDTLAGTYGGIGVQLQRSEMGDFILFPFEDSPAEKAGIQEGDLLIAVNGTPVELTTQQDAVDQMMRGEVKEGNGVEITVKKANDEELTVFILFDVINVPSVLWRVLPENTDIGYVHILRFTNRTPSELEQALTELRTENIEALILDLRNNTGGLLQESIKVASEFVDGGVVLYEKRREGEKEFTAETGGLMLDLPLVVLVNRSTASAAELVAGAILDRDRGILIGQKTYGKGTIQQIFQLSDRSSIHVTSAEWLTPKKRVLDGVGLEPAISMIPDENGRDVEIGEAIRYLEQQLQEQDSS